MWMMGSGLFVEGMLPVDESVNYLSIVSDIIFWWYCCYQERPYHDDNTASRLLSEVKHHRARLVLRWGTTLESRVLFFCLLPMTRLMLLVKPKVLTVLLYGKTSILAKEPFSRLLLFSQCSYLQYSTYYSVLTIYYHVGVPFFLLRAS